jgi:hypothetical protein
VRCLRFEAVKKLLALSFMESQREFYCGFAWLFVRVAHFCAFRKSGAFSERGCHAQIVPHGHRQPIPFLYWLKSLTAGAAPFVFKGADFLNAQLFAALLRAT